MNFFNNIFNKARQTQSSTKQRKVNDVMFANTSLNPSFLRIRNKDEFRWAFEHVPEIYAIIAYMSEAFSKVIWIHQMNGELVRNSPVTALLNRPNPIEGGKEFNKNLYANWKIFGNCYTYGNYPSKLSKLPVTLFNVPAQYTIPVGTGRYFEQTEIDEIISHYIMRYGNTEKVFPTNSILHKSDLGIEIKDGEYLQGYSRLASLEKPISNIIAAYEARNVFLVKKGAIGILSSDASKDESIPLTEPAQKKIQENWNKFGLAREQFQFVFTETSIKWTPITFPIKDLEIDKTIDEAITSICNVMAFPRTLFNDLKNSSFANMEHGDRILYQNTIIPDAEDLANEYERFFNLPDNEQIIPSFAHVEALQKNRKDNSIAVKTMSNSLNELLKSYNDGNIKKEQLSFILETEYGYSKQQISKLL